MVVLTLKKRHPHGADYCCLEHILGCRNIFIINALNGEAKVARYTSIQALSSSNPNLSSARVTAYQMLSAWLADGMVMGNSDEL